MRSLSARSYRNLAKAAVASLPLCILDCAMAIPAPVQTGSNKALETYSANENDSGVHQKDKRETKTVIIHVESELLAYVNVKTESGWRDELGAKVSFYYQNGRKWNLVPGCVGVFSCDISQLPSAIQTFKAIFEPPINSNLARSSVQFPPPDPPLKKE